MEATYLHLPWIDMFSDFQKVSAGLEKTLSYVALKMPKDPFMEEIKKEIIRGPNINRTEFLYTRMVLISLNSTSTRVSKRCDCTSVRSRKVFQRLRRIWAFGCKNAQFTTFKNFFWVIFDFFVSFWSILFAQNF